jgi:hypothetical protein
MVYKKTKGYAMGGMAKKTKGYAKGGMSKKTKGYAKGGMTKKTKGYAKGGMAKKTKGYAKGGMAKGTKGYAKGGMAKKTKGYAKGGMSKTTTKAKTTPKVRKKDLNKKGLLKPNGIDVYAMKSPPILVYDHSEAYRKQQKGISDSKRKKQRTGKK